MNLRSISRSIVKNLKFMVSFYETQTNMSISEILLRNIDEKINIIVEKSHQFPFNSFVRGYHAYMDVWTPNVGDENLYLETEDRNEYDKNALAVITDRKTGGHIPKNLSKTFKRFLTLPNCTIKCTVIGKIVMVPGYRLEVSVNFKFLGPAKAIQWAENGVKKVIQNKDQSVKHCKK